MHRTSHTTENYPVLMPPAPPKLRNPGLHIWRGRKLPCSKCWGSLENHSDIQDISVCHPSPFLFGTCLLLPLLYGLNADPTLYGTSVGGSVCWHTASLGSSYRFTLTYWIALSSITIPSAFSHSHNFRTQQDYLLGRSEGWRWQFSS